MKVIRYNNEFADRWDYFINESKNGSFLFKRDFMEYHADRFIDFSLIALDGEQIVAILPANLRNNILYSHQGLTYGGLVVEYKTRMPIIIQAFKSILEFLHQNQISTLYYKALPKIYHAVPSDEVEWALTMVKAELYRRDSTLTINNKNPLPFQERRMRAIKKASKLNPVIKTNETDAFNIFWSKILEPNMMQKHGLKPVHSIDEMNLLASYFPENIKQYNVYLNDQIMAGCTMFINKTVAHAQYISSSEEGRANGCIDYLFKHLIKDEFANIPYFDFGNSNEELGTKINFGLMDWKEGFGGRAISHDFYLINTANHSLLENVRHNG
jgi:hypothetical protein